MDRKHPWVSWLGDVAVERALALGGIVGTLLDDLFVLSRMASAFRAGTYRDVPPKTLLLAVSAAAYFVIPIRVIPRALNAVGMLEDTALIAAALAAVRTDIDRFLAWEAAARV